MHSLMRSKLADLLPAQHLHLPWSPPLGEGASVDLLSLPVNTSQSIMEFWSVWPNTTCNGKTYLAAEAHQSLMTASFTDHTVNTIYSVTFTFQESALYHKNRSLLCDDNSSIFLSHINLSIISNITTNDEISTDPTWWNWTKGNSFSCNQVYLFTFKNYVLNVTNIQVQAFMATSDFNDG